MVGSWKINFLLRRPILPKTNIAPENKLKIDLWKTRFLLETTSFRCYVLGRVFSEASAVSLRECISISTGSLTSRKLHENVVSCQTVTMDVGTLMVELDLLAKLLCLFKKVGLVVLD